MNVFDNNNIYRDYCSDYITLQINTKDINSNNNHQEKVFVVTITSISNEITVDDRLRLLGNIINYDQDELSKNGIMKYYWSEVNGLLSNEEISQYQESLNNNSINLILSENVLTSGLTYSFQLVIEQYDTNNIENEPPIFTNH